MKSKTSAKSFFVFALVSLFLFYEMGVQVSPSVMTGDLMRDLHIDAIGLGLMSAFYFYTYTGMQIPAGMLLDKFGVRHIVATALVICALGAALFGVTHSMVGGSWARASMGFGSAFAFISVLAVADRWFDKKHFAILAGFAQLFAALGAMGGEIPVAYIVDHIGWRQTMWGLALISVLLAALVGAFMREPDHQFKEENRVCDKKISEGLKIILKNPQTWTVGLYAFLNWAPMSLFASLWGVPFLTTAYHMSNGEAATFVSLMWVGIGLASPLIGFWSDAIRRRILLLRVTTFLGLLAASSIVYWHLSLWVLGVLLFLQGAACSGQVLSFAVVKDNATHNAKATAIAVNNMAVVAAGIVFQPLVGFLLHHHSDVSLASDHPIYGAADYRYALMVLPVVYCLGLLVSLFFIRETFCHER
ncbi:MAG TPA: MFS transporter [Coxiellaceae bacterium]|nr:MFS transporter [Coxiellaceae bacterium]